MMSSQLSVARLLWRAENVNGARINTAWTSDGVRSFTYRDLVSDVRDLAGALASIGVKRGSRIATMAWNTRQHLAAYFAVPALGAVLHTVNHRMPVEHMAYTINHVSDEVLIVDEDLLPSVEAMRGRIPTVRHLVVVGEPGAIDGFDQVIPYDQFVSRASTHGSFQEVDENTAASICFTSGTTGLPKGVVYSHRSIVLHAMAISTKGGVEIDAERAYLLATQMSHVNGWGVPYAAALQGARLVLPGPHPTPERFLDLIHGERPDTFVGSPTVAALIRDEHLRRNCGYDLSELKTMWLGGQVPPVALARWWAEQGARVVNGWGMTETSPMGTFSPGVSMQGRPLPLFELRVVDESGSPQDWDGQTVGELEVRSPWVAREYLDDPRTPDSFRDGWLRTGDVATVHPDAGLQIKDREKDLVKSGGEWISSVDLENALMLHPAVSEAAVIAIPDDTWQERPLAWLRLDADVTDEELRTFLATTLPRFWLPDRFVRVDEIPKTAMGKIDKADIRRQHRENTGQPTFTDQASTASDGRNHNVAVIPTRSGTTSGL
ncbi:long-chain fatty acid--CoA ligase [Rhodococcus opacus]|uniref:long-chain fatty acid--CoA ligase n=1 Tax=Rhodococcus opacus TaxID=37919 RepID=UPI0022368614|nr:long-chain fatty acid--CoA ligase [Rhodococcus opacus]UZG55158.1 long-chain fatty acid--CoA ligase [Rhodococcus opacus]